MPLDPQVAQLLAWAARSRQRPYHEVGVAAARSHYEKAAVLLEVPPAGLHDVHDLRAELPGRTLTLRRYVPVVHTWAEPQPALLFFHGGGFTIGSLDTHDRLCRTLAAASGVTILAVDYRLAPEHRFPAAVHDAFDTLAWVRREAASLAIDAACLAVGGDSAGGTLAAACALHARDAGWPLALQLLLYPGLASWQATESHGRFANGYLLDAETVQWFFANYLIDASQRHDWRFAPLAAASVAGVAPAWMALAEYDPLVDEGLAYAQRLRDAGVAVECLTYAGMVHAFFQHGGFVRRVRPAHCDAAAALAHALGAALSPARAPAPGR